jgi:hypothetical protein
VRNENLRASREKRLGTPAEWDTPENKQNLLHNISATQNSPKKRYLRELLMPDEIPMGGKWKVLTTWMVSLKKSRVFSCWGCQIIMRQMRTSTCPIQKCQSTNVGLENITCQFATNSLKTLGKLGDALQGKK